MTEEVIEPGVALWYKLVDSLNDQVYSNTDELKCLVHYTNFASFKSIVENNELWFSSIDRMNDYNEVRHGKRLVQELVRDDSSEVSTIVRDLMHSYPNQLAEVDKVFIENSLSDPYDTFISCWSNCDLVAFQHDNLAMWRSYAADGNGVAIAIDPKVIQLGTLRYSEITFWPVRYETEHEFAHRCAALLRIFRDALVSLSDEERNLPASIFASAFNELLFFLAVTHKHPGFGIEREWRFVWRRSHSSNKYLEYLKPQISARGLFEFFCLPLKDDPELANGPITLDKILTEVMIGPTSDLPHKHSATLNMLRRAGIDLSRVKVTASSIPYRSS
ncbi:DUF2971 domain-containing protein [Hyphomonas sp. NPDC076900]|uniref:DUF2971 domain-containing protein n=1 Tax=unclassified Hyphomonas TaxID=2630699 RepID=UPI003D004CA0